MMEERSDNQPRRRRETQRQPLAARRKRMMIAAGAAAILVVVAAVLWFALGRPSDPFDPNAQAGQAPYKSAEEVQAELDRIVEEGMFNISIASVVEFADGQSEGTAYIENVPGNRYLMKVSIALDDTGETVYESGVLKPDSYIDSIKLAKDLDPGTYAATATFTALEQDSLEEAGKAAAKLTLVVRG